MHRAISNVAYHRKMNGQPWNDSIREVTMPPLLQTVLTESADLFVRTIKMTVAVALLTLAIILIGWFFSSSLPQQALIMINGR